MAKQTSCQWKYFLAYNHQPDAEATPECAKPGTTPVKFENPDGNAREKIMLCNDHRGEAFKRRL